MTTLLLDLDGTLCDTRHRAHMVKGTSKPDWDAYSLACYADRPVPGVMDLVCRMWAHGAKVIILSGRGQVAYARTTKWLDDHAHFEWERLYLRSPGDEDTNPVYKTKVVRSLRADGYEDLLAIDDYPKVAEALAAIGVPTVLVARDGVAAHPSYGHVPQEVVDL